MKREISLSSRILYEDNHIIAVNKLPSELVQGDKTGDIPLCDHVKEYIGQKYNKPGNVFLGVVHRIDRPVSGVILFARTSKALARLNELIKNKEIRKKYWAVVKNRPGQGSDKLTHYLRKNEKQNKSYVAKPGTKASKKAELNYKIISSSDNYYLLEIELITGRHHQVRAQLSAIGCPIKGDLKYGFDHSNSDASIHLHARELLFVHPVNNSKISLVASTPDEKLWNYFND